MQHLNCCLKNNILLEMQHLLVKYNNPRWLCANLYRISVSNLSNFPYKDHRILYYTWNSAHRKKLEPLIGNIDIFLLCLTWRKSTHFYPVLFEENQKLRIILLNKPLKIEQCLKIVFEDKMMCHQQQLPYRRVI
jgi:hypothetical protein